MSGSPGWKPLHYLGISSQDTPLKVQAENLFWRTGCILKGATKEFDPERAVQVILERVDVEA